MFIQITLEFFLNNFSEIDFQQCLSLKQAQTCPFLKKTDTATKTRIDAAKTASKRVVQKTAASTGDLIGNKIPDQITSLGKTKSK